MNTINDKFNFARFGAVLKCDLVEHRWRYISAFFIMFVALSGFQLAQAADYLQFSKMIEGVDIYPNFTDTVTAFFYIVLALALCCAVSEISLVMKTKGKAMNYLMLPATNLEKFLSRVLIAIVGVFIMAFVALFLSDVMRMLILPAFDDEYVGELYRFAFPQVISNLGDPFFAIYEEGGIVWGDKDGLYTIVGFNHYLGYMAVAFLTLSILVIHSFFVLGGCIWRKGAVVKTLLVGLVVTLLGVWLLVKLSPILLECECFNKLPELWFETGHYVMKILVLIANVVFLGITIFNWWLAYRLFSRKQMIPRTHLFGSKHPHHLFKKAHS